MVTQYPFYEKFRRSQVYLDNAAETCTCHHSIAQSRIIKLIEFLMSISKKS